MDATERSGLQFEIRHQRLIRLLVLVAGLLIAVSTFGQWLKYSAGYGNVGGLIPRFFLGSELSVPTYFSSFLLLLNAVLLAVIAIHQYRLNSRFAFRWKLLSLLFLYVSVDEMAALHELTIDPLRNVLGVGGIFHFAWVIPGLVFIALVGMYYVPFLLDLSARWRWRFIVAGALYVGGAIGVEMIGGNYAALHGYDNLTYRLHQTVEESCEIFGLLYFAHALLSYVRDEIPLVSIYSK